MVWNEGRRKLLIDSIKNGLPIGAILLYKKGPGEKDEITEYQLIDGLQRVTTLKKYNDKPTDFYDENNLDPDFVVIVLKFLKNEIGLEISEDSIKRYLIEWIRSRTGFEETDGFSSSDLVRFIDEKIKDKFGKELEKKSLLKLIELVKPYLKRIKDESDIRDFEIPVIVYTGNPEELPIIFQRINSKGTQLNKYQIFAATWTAYDPIEIKNTEIIEKIKAKYEALIDEGLEIENYDPTTFYTSKFTYFEYLFGFGKLLAEKYPLLFKTTSPEHEADSIGFNIVAICLGHNLRKMETLPESLRKVDLNILEEKILEVVDFLDTILKPFIGIKANKKSGTPFPVVHTEFQIVSLIGKIFKSKYKIDFVTNKIEENENWTEKEEALRKNIPYHYLYDIIKGFWSGTGDKKAMERANSDWYEKPIDKESWESLLIEWHENEKNKKEKNRASINKVSVLFLKYIYTHLLTAHEELSSTEFEVDHIIPFARLRNIARQIDGLPISALGNLALIKKNLNRDKRDRTFYEYFDELVENGEITESQKDEEIKKIEKYTFTTREMLEFIKSLSTENIEDFYNYLDERFKRMREVFYKVNRIS